MRFTIAIIMGIVLLIALGLAALREANVLWASGLYTLTLTSLCTAVLGSMAGRGRARMTWAGFAAVGWSYLLMSFGRWPNSNGVTAPPFPATALYQKPRLDREATSLTHPTFVNDPEPRGEPLLWAGSLYGIPTGTVPGGTGTGPAWTV